MAIPGVLALLAVGFVLTRRRSASNEDAWEAQPEALVETVPEPAPPVRDIAPAPLPAPAFTPAPARPVEPVRARGQIEFQPVSMRLSLVYATLQFRLLLRTQTEIPAGKLLGDMISAHGSLPQSMQLAPPPEALGVLQPIPPLAPGQTLDVKGELRLPLNAIRPLQQGGASFMVPLVRLALLGDEGTSPHLELGCVFTVGIPGSGPALAPLRLDTGPRDFATLAAREIETARRTALLALDPARAAG